MIKQAFKAHSFVAYATIVSVFASSIATPSISFAIENNAANQQNNLRMVTTPQQNGNQTSAQQDTQKKNEDGSDSAKIISLLTIGMGGAMIYMGQEMMTTSPPMGAMMMMQGAITLLSGLQGMQGSKKMAGNAGAAGFNAGSMISGTDPISRIGDSSLRRAEFKVDPALLREGKVGEAMDKLEKLSGIPREKFADAALNSNGELSGMSGIFAGGKKGLGNAKTNSLFSAATEKAKDPNAVKDALAKAGIDANSINSSYGAGSGLASASSTKSKKDSSFDDFLNGMNNKDEANAPSAGGIAGTMSPEVQAALEKNGINDKSVFEMVRAQYKKQAPVMFGYDKSPASEADPFGVEQPQGI